MQTAPARQGRRFLFFVLAALAGVAVLWSAVWFVAARRLSNHLLLSSTESPASPLAHLCAVKEISGFPFRLKLRCAGFAAPLHVAGVQVTAKADEANGEASLFAPNHIVLSLTSPLAFVRVNGSPLASLQYDALNVDLHWSGRQLIDTTAVAQGVNFSPAPTSALAPFKVQSLNVRLEQVMSSDAGDALRFHVTGEGLQLPVLNALLRADSLGQLQASGEVRPSPVAENEIAAGWKGAAEAWRAKQGAINFETIEFVDGPLNLRVNGPLALDDAHRLAGRLNVQAIGAGPLLARLGLPAQIGQAQGILGALLGVTPKTNAAADSLNLTVTLAQGRISLGPLRLPWALAPLY